jgi:ribokinase
MAKENLKDDLVAEADCATGCALIFLEKSGQNSIVVISGANAAWPSTLSDPLQDAIKRSSLVLLQREIPDAINLQVAKLAKAHKVPVFLDMGGRDSPLPEEILPFLYAISPNETELSRLVGLPTDTHDQVLILNILRRGGCCGWDDTLRRSL